MLLLAMLLSGPAEAAKKPPVLMPLTEAIGAPLDKDGEKVLKYASNCKEGDLYWKRLIDQQTGTLTQITDAMGASVLCWQTAEKKALKVGEPIAPLTAWISGWTRTMESKKDFYWVMEAQMSNDARRICKRVFVSQDRAQAAVAATIDLPAIHSSENAAPLVNLAVGEAQTSLAAMNQLFREQNCEGREQ